MFDSGKIVGTNELARHLGRSRVTLWEMRKRAPLLDEWVRWCLDRAHASLASQVMTRFGTIALRSGSVKHGEVFLRATGRLKDASAGPVGGMVQVNILGVPERADLSTWQGGYLPDAKRTE